MDVSTAAALRIEIEGKIERLLEDFSNTTSLTVESVYVRATMTEHLSAEIKVGRGYRVTIDARLA